MNDIFQVWIESPHAPDEKILGFMLSVINNRPEGSSYTLIAPRNYFEDKTDIIFFPLDVVIKQVISTSSTIEEIWPKLSVHQKSEIIRTYIASTKSSYIYFDCDIELVNWSISLPDNLRPVFLKTKTGKFDNNAFFVNGNTEFFKNFLEELSLSMRTLIRRNERIRYSHTYSLINTKDVEVLDSDFVIHHNRE